MKKIETIVEDIYGVLGDKTHEYSEENVREFSESLSRTLKSKLEKDQTPRLRFSNIGEKCSRRLWYQINKPELAEPLPPWTRMKFLFGDVIEAIVLFLAKEAGHSVTGEQTTLELEGIKGQRDGVIDGVTIDVKSASTDSMRKFKDHLEDKSYVDEKTGRRVDTDPFGYLDQVSAYTEAGQKDDLVTDKERFGFLAVDKTLGHIVLDLHSKRKDSSEYFKRTIKSKIDVVSAQTTPNRGYAPEPDGKSGNEKLGTKCSYCEFRKSCYPETRTFLYSNGPRYLTKVIRLPDVPEVTQ